MVWFKVDDKFHSHTKVLHCSEAALGVWTKLGSWCAEQLNGGRVSRAALKHFRIKNSRATELVRVGLWIEVGDEYQFHDWDDHQPSKQQVLAQRQATKARVTRHRNAVTDTPSDATCNGVTNAVGNAAPVPSRPVPFSSEISSHLDAAEASQAREEFSGGGAIKSTVQPDYLRASAGAAWLSQATGQEPYSTNTASKHYRALIDLSAKPEAERAIAARVLAQEAQKPEVLGYLTPQHVVDNWRFYGKGEAPGKRLAKGPPGESSKWQSRIQQSTKTLEELRERRSQLQPGSPNYAADLYDLDKAIREETERLDRRKRELHALTG